MQENKRAAVTCHSSINFNSLPRNVLTLTLRYENQLSSESKVAVLLVQALVNANFLILI